MPPLPPAKDVLNALQLDVLPAAGGAALVMCVFCVLGGWGQAFEAATSLRQITTVVARGLAASIVFVGRNAGVVGAAAAVVVAFLWANHDFKAVSWDNTHRLIPWNPDDPKKAWQWLPRVALVMVVVGIASRWLGQIAAGYLPERRWWGANLLVWAPRLGAVAVASRWLVPESAAAERTWLVPALAAAMALEWVVLDSVARTKPGAGGQVAAYLSAAFFAAAAVLIYHHWAGAMEIAVVLGAAMFGLAAAAGAAKEDASGAVPAGVAFLPGLMLAGRLSMDSKIPVAAFWLVALAPLALTPFLIPRLARQSGWAARVARAVLMLIPLVIAVALADQHEQLAFGGDEW
jgi:hypothetical protein